MRVLVTGNKGYIGSVLCPQLEEAGYEVAGLDTGFFQGCEFLPFKLPLKQVTKDVRAVEKEDLAGVDYLIHLAALSNDPLGEINPDLTKDINYQASVRLAELARQAGVKRFIFSSSCSVYGIAGDEAIDESGQLDPVTEYAKSKVATEKEVASMADESFSPVFMRNSTVYGASPMHRVDLVVNNLVGWAYTTGSLRIMSDGSPWRPLIHVEDICSVFIAMLNAPPDLVHNQVFNVGRDTENYRIKDIADVIKEAFPSCEIDYTGEHGADTRSYRVDFGKLASKLDGYCRFNWDIEKGVRQLLGAYRERGLTFEDFQGKSFIRLKQIKYLIEEGLVDQKLFWTGGKTDD